MASLLLALCLVFTLLPVNTFATGADDIVRIANGEVGVSGRPNKYTYWCGRIPSYPNNGYDYPWCACFVGWCANQAGESSAISKTASVADLYSGILNAGGKPVSDPQAGDIVIYRRRSDGYYAHTDVRAYPSNGCSVQRWYILGTQEPGKYALRAVCTNCVVDINNNSSAEGENVQMYESNGTGAQLFQIIAAPAR